MNQIVGDINKGVQTQSHLDSSCCGEPSRVEEALDDPNWVNAMHEELNNFTQ
jgi:hypothetical protein